MAKTFFILTFAFMLMACSTPQVREEPPVEVVEPPVEVMEVVESPVAELLLPDGVSIRDTERGKVLVINPTRVHFYSGKTKMYKGYNNIFALAKQVLDMNPSVNMVLEGHTSKPGKAYPYNYNLSVNRSKASLNYLKKIDTSADRLIIQGLGESLPEYEKVSQNRRLEFVIIENEDDLKIYKDYVKNADIKKEMS